MSKVARAASKIRAEHMQRERDRIMADVRDILEKEYDSADDAEKLLRNIDTALNLRWEFDIACTRDSYYFGHLLDALRVTEAECLDAVHSLVHGTAISNDLNNLKEYEIIRRRCGDFEGCRSDDERWERLLKSYRYWRTREQAVAELARRKIDVDVLFREKLRPKTNQVFIADHIMKLWADKVLSDEIMNTFTSADGFSPVLMKDLVSTLLDSASRLGLADCIADRIASEVSIANLANVRESLVADMMASIVNSFVCDFGYSMLSPELKEKARLLVDENALPAYDYMERPRQSSYSREELADLFEDMSESGVTLTESFDRHYNEWLEYMTIAYVVHLRRSSVRPEANRELGQIINTITI